MFDLNQSKALLQEYSANFDDFLQELLNDNEDEYSDVSELCDAIFSKDVPLDDDQYYKFQHLLALKSIQEELVDSLTAIDSGNRHAGKKDLEKVIRHAREIRKEANIRIVMAHEEIERMNAIIDICKVAQE